MEAVVMPLSNKYKIFSILFILFLLSVPFLISPFFNPQKSELFQGVRQRKASTDFTKRSMIANDKVVLLKDNSLTINNCRLVFKGLKNDMIHLDLYLLELDPESAYPHFISKEKAANGVRLGDSEFQLISANKNILKLKISDLYQTY